MAIEKITRSDDEWRKILTPEQFKVTRNKGTERAFCGVFHDNHQAGVYTCVCCALPLFSSQTKFDSGTGWPSFFQPVDPENVTTEVDRSFGHVRTEILCARCDAHLGHVFNDGPAPTQQRYCLNSAALNFVPQSLEANSTPPAEAKATFGAGCFWGVEAAFRNIPDVIEAVSGYEGGTLPNPTYHDVCTGRTGHAEVVEVTYDPARVSYEQLMEAFYKKHDPTTLNRQGPDTGSQYRSAIFYHNDAQRAAAEKMKRELDAAGRFRRPIVTQIEPAGTFYRAEEYHQRYLEKHQRTSCAI